MQLRWLTIPGLSFLWVLSIAVSPPADAASLCSEPLKPICVGEDMTYEDQAMTVRCQGDLKRYSQEMTDYVSCLQQAIRDSSDLVQQARAEFDRRRGN